MTQRVPKQSALTSSSLFSGSWNIKTLFPGNCWPQGQGHQAKPRKPSHQEKGKACLLKGCTYILSHLPGRILCLPHPASGWESNHQLSPQHTVNPCLKQTPLPGKLYYTSQKQRGDFRLQKEVKLKALKSVSEQSHTDAFPGNCPQPLKSEGAWYQQCAQDQALQEVPLIRTMVNERW